MSIPHPPASAGHPARMPLRYRRTTATLAVVAVGVLGLTVLVLALVGLTVIA